MKIYFAINDFEDLESHFDLNCVYFSKKDLLKDLYKIKKEGLTIYSADNSVTFFNRNRFISHEFSEFEKI